MSKKNIEKVYQPDQVEEKWMVLWEKDGLFHADVLSDRQSFSMVIPPPNVTGSLHLGHALNNTLQDILARWKRMCGYNVLWLPGMDHAGIATQNVVERQLAKEGSDRRALGRDGFIERVWEWKQASGGTILKQLKRLGASCDWERERFTMDEGLSRAVQEVFVQLYKEGLIYRDERLINLCSRCRTALSDIEVEHEEVQGKMYHIKYPLADDPETFLTVATTRPETMLGDTAVAVHPDDPRFNQFIGKKIRLPLTFRTIPIVGDSILVDRDFGTGAVKVTPGHDFNDEKVGKRHHLPKISLIDWNGTMHPFALQEEARVEPDLLRALASKSMAEARVIVIERLEAEEFLLKAEDHKLALGRCYRCKTVVEPFNSPQWFVKVNDPENSLAQPAIDAVRQKKIRLIPESWEANYFGWMENIEDWCISRQIWWGHKIPVWYCKACDDKYLLDVPGSEEMIITLEATPIVGAKSCPRCGSDELVQDPDVLDTWFSSALWPFSTSGWPIDLQPNPEGRKEAEHLLERFYPTSTLVSGFDILFFWVARMAMMGLHFMKDVPFREVYIHALVRDEAGQKMSKSKGNVIDPLNVMKEYGTDALRFTLASMASPGRDIKLSAGRIEGYRNFANKLWNAARFIMMNLPEEKNGDDVAHVTPQKTAADLWIEARLCKTSMAVNDALAHYRFDEASKYLYQFVWHEFCDWYLEMVKVDFQEAGDGCEHPVLLSTYEAILKLLHPFMPFITEELWSYLASREGSIMLASYPVKEAGTFDPSMEQVVQEVIINTVEAIRNLRGEMNISPSVRMTLLVKAKNEKAAAAFERHLPYIKRLGRISEVTIGCDLINPGMAASVSTSLAEIYLPLDEVQLRGEILRIEKSLSKAEKELSAVEKKLENPRFITNAPKEIVEKNKGQRDEWRAASSKLAHDLKHFQELLLSEKEPS
ncbi:MAG: valine--tRNA ligase [Nitrospira sp.]|nr:valine--tRNA ligase [Candidatus Manganitrophaceae bacterium]HIL35031.1 valine--tRNA ligase [Candidatus Manganitrophaceae bacterium]